MRVVITGATGYIGCALVARLLELGHDVVAESRDPTRARAMLGVEAFARAPLAGADGVIALAGEPVLQRWTPAARRRMWESRVDHVLDLADRIRSMPEGVRPGVLVTASATAAYSVGRSHLRGLCAAWEVAAGEAPTRVVRVRIPVVLGPGAPGCARLPFVGAAVGLGAVGDGFQAVPWIHLDDLVQVFVTALASDWSGTIAAVAGVSPQQVVAAELRWARGQRLALDLPTWAARAMVGREAADEVLLASHPVPRSLHLGSAVLRYQTLQEAADAVALAERSDPVM